MPQRKVPSIDILKDLYEQGLSAREIAEKLQLNVNTVMSALQRYGLYTRTTSETKQQQKARGVETKAVRAWLGKKQPRDMVEKRTAKIRGENHWAWKGGFEAAKKANRKPAESVGRPSTGHFAPGTHWRPPQPFWEKEWLVEEYVVKQRSTQEIADQFGVKDEAILFWLRKHDIPRRTTAEAREVKHWGVEGELNPMFGKRGAASPNWKGGSTPERQAFYSSIEWKHLSNFIWKRDNAHCQRCDKHFNRERGHPFHIHHIVSFIYEPLRLEPTNLVLLCNQCHRWVHSSKNTEKLFLLPIPDDGIVPRGGDAS